MLRQEIITARFAPLHAAGRQSAVDPAGQLRAAHGKK
jgi:hypothetical protein